MRLRPLLAIACLLGVSWCAGAVASDDAPSSSIQFNRDVRPILAEYCLHCHGPDDQNREADLRLDVAEHAHDAAVFPGEPQHSPLIERIESEDADLRMPPPESKKTLSRREIETLKQWIREGARYEGHWAFEPIRTPEVPAADTVKHGDLTAIDRFLNERLRAASLEFAPRISKQQWIRRATFDLTGLPPTWQEVQAFLRDASAEAYERVIDRLLASPRYGERWGRHWLDLARYADTHGGSAIGFTRFPFSYTYRDYVIKAFNRDVPYDRFVTEQLAADQLGLDANDPSLAALGFLTVGMQFRNPHDLIDDQIDVTTRGLLGLTVACARCHDHKYDPVPTADYYALYATFASSEKPELPPIIGRSPETEAYRRYDEQLQQREVIHDDMRRDQTAVMRGRLRMQVGLYLRELAKGVPEQDLAEAFLSYRTDDIRPLVLNRWRDYLAKMPAEDPVFGPWVTLAELNSESAESFAAAARRHVEQWQQENGDAADDAKSHRLGADPPKWNPMVLGALSDPFPRSMLEVADAYGKLFADVNRQWLTALLEASLEASPDGDIIPDNDSRHRVVNSSIHQQLRRHLYAPGTPTAMDPSLSAKVLNRTIRDNLRGKRNAIEKLHLNSPGSPPRAMVLEERVPEKPFHVFRRGNPIDRGETVQPHFLTAVSKRPPQRFPDSKRRLALAEAITDPENPLFRRVIVNWVWQKHFGIGLVRTPDDFGTRSDPPTHPQLLDHLAEKLLDDGWSLKKLHKRIMLSRVYAQAAREDSRSRTVDPENRLLWRMPRRRLSMEAMRDAMLAASGELNVGETGGRPFDFLAQPVVPRRSVYGFINRDIINSLASRFDGANPTACTAQRSETVVPQQTLFALNSDFIQDRAEAFAQAASEASQSASDRVRYLYRRGYGREPGTAELADAVAYLQTGDAAESLRQLAHVILASNEFVFVD